MIRKYKVLFFILFLLLLFSLQLVEAKKEEKTNLAGKIITVDPGHGGRDSGTMYGKIYEKDLNLEISKKLKTVLEEAGATVYMIREDDSDLSSKWDAQKKRGDLYRRILFIKKKRVIFTYQFISIGEMARVKKSYIIPLMKKIKYWRNQS